MSPVSIASRNLLFVAMLICVAGCSAPHNGSSAQITTPRMTVEGAVPFPSPSLWPTYKALDYRTAYPPLTVSEATHVRHILARVRPCQQDIVYYAYPSNGDRDEPLVVFFKGPSYVWPHVLAGGNEYYKPEEGNAFPGASGGDYDFSLAADIRNHPCPSDPIAIAKPPPTRSPFPSLWPSYRATDYRSARPPLSAGQTAQLKLILAQVRACQRPFVRYAFTNDVDESRRFVLFFQSPHDDWPHVLDQQNLYYKKADGTTFALHSGGSLPDFSLAADMRSHPCPEESGQVGATVLGPN